MRIFQKFSSKYKTDFNYAKQWPGLCCKLLFFFPEIIRTITNNKGEVSSEIKIIELNFKINLRPVEVMELVWNVTTNVD